MTKGERLIWQLFEMVKELMPPTETNAKRFNDWAGLFHSMEHPEVPPTAAVVEPAADEVAEGPVDEPDEPDPDPHEHGVPSRPRTRKKR